jgi:hypothetical protein
MYFSKGKAGRKGSPAVTFVCGSDSFTCRKSQRDGRTEAMQKGMNGWLCLPLAQNVEQLKGVQGCSFKRQPRSQEF